jgi:transmembrane sensor
MSPPPGNIVNFPERAAIEEEAARWVVRHEEGLSVAERAQFDAWRAASPAHADAFARLRTHWGELDTLGRLAQRTPRPMWKQPIAWAGAGALAAAVVAAVLIKGAIDHRPAPAVEMAQAPAQVYTTALGAQERIALSDGSTVIINTASRIETRMTESERSVRLLSGEAFFEVAHDASRPFRVYAGDGVTTAVGTAFSVRLENNNDVKVVVRQGKVSFSNVSDRVEPVAYVSAGQSGTFNEQSDVVRNVEPAVIDRQLSWTGGRLAFAGEPLSTVVAEIARYTDIEFTYATPELASMPIGGLFDVGEVDHMLDSLEAGVGLQVERIDAHHVRILGARQ